jgi:hypothetical protein
LKKRELDDEPPSSKISTPKHMQINLKKAYNKQIGVGGALHINNSSSQDGKPSAFRKRKESNDTDKTSSNAISSSSLVAHLPPNGHSRISKQ